MEWSSVKLWLFPLWCTIILVQLYVSRGCYKEEKTALLEFKQYVKFHDDDSLLPSWVDDDPNSDCCDWERVTCNPSSGHVAQLSLDRLVDVEHSVSLNLSSFLPFKELRSLSLSFNYFSGWILTEDYRSMSTLKMLETLDLSTNMFKGSIIKPLSSLQSLRHLILADNSIRSYFPVQELSAFRNLEMLDLSLNLLSSPTNQDNNALTSLKKLRTLNLAKNMFDKEIFKSLAALPALKSLFLNHNEMEGSLGAEDFGNLTNLSNLEVLILRSNELEGPLPQGLCEMKNLRELDLSFNLFEGPLPSCLSNLSSLQGLDLSSNTLTGNLPSSVIASLTSLEFLSLSRNQFEGSFPLSILANHSRLKLLSLGMDDNEFQVETENPPWIPSFQLQVLDMPSCKMNMPTGSIPQFLLYQHDLQYIDLSGNKLVGMFPNWLFINNSKLEFVLINDNFLTGALELPINLTQGMQWNQMKVLRISNNNIRGRLPQNIGNFFPNLEYLNASSNALIGEIPSSFGNLSALWMLDLSSNNFTGEIPTQLLSGCITLSYLKLSYNSISGQIFPRPLNLSHLYVLLLDNNYFSGTLQEGFLDLNSLYALRLSNNKLTGSLPAWIGNFTNLEALSMSWNYFSGAIPEEVCDIDLSYINLSHNKLAGSIPPCFSNTKLEFLHLHQNSLVGSISKELLTSLNLMTLDLGGNKLSGTFPDQIHGSGSLRALLLGGNNLQGQLPNQICQLEELRLLDLSSNNFSGEIPACLSNMSFGKGEVQYESINYPEASTYTYVAEDFVLEFTSLVATNFLSDDSASVVEMEFRTKKTLLSYHGTVLTFMSLLDLSSNQFTGEIPWQMGDLISLHSLNLSHNYLNGFIPESLHNLKELESLDLSWNNLSGMIPPQLQDLQFLSFFNVSYNNLSGRAPDKGQFATFDESSYEENPHLTRSISNEGSNNGTTSAPPFLFSDEDESAIEVTAFYWSFGASYVAILLILVTIIWINPRWRMEWFYFIDRCIYRFSLRVLKIVY